MIFIILGFVDILIKTENPSNFNNKWNLLTL